MPKRAATPPPSEDEPKYLAIVHPYPAHANMAIRGDQLEFVFWLAACAGQDPLHALFHKPSAHGMVLIEVDRDFEGFDRLLGAHAWSSFLKHPSAEESGMTSKIFFSTYRSGREVQKHGWKRVDIRNEWFRREPPENLVDMEHYPRSTYCDVPREGRTTYPLCCPLPVRWFPPPSKPAVPPVGSAQWHATKAGIPPPQALVGSPRRREARSAGAFPALAAHSQGPKSKGSQAPTKSINVPRPALAPGNPWNRGAPCMKPPTPALSTTSSRSYSSASESPIYISGPSSLVHAPIAVHSGQKIAWGHDKADAETLAPAFVKRWADEVEDDLDSRAESRASNAAVMSTAQALADLSFGSEEDDCGLPNVKNMAAKTDHNLCADPSADDVPVQNLWSDYSEEDPVGPAKILCRVHGVVCKKGICREYARQLKEADGNGNGAGRNKLQTKAGGVGRSTHGPDVVVRKAAPTWGPSGPPVSRPPSTISSASKGSIQAQGARGNPWGNVKQTAVGSGLGTQRTANVNANSRGGAWNAASGNSASGSSPWATIVKGPPADAWPGLNPQIPVPAKKAQPLQTRPAKAIVEKAPVVASGGDDAGWGDESQVW